MAQDGLSRSVLPVVLALGDGTREVRVARPLIGTSPAMQQVRHMVARVAPTSSTVLVDGESGTGKELAARAIHDASARCAGAFVAVQASALAESLVESELFGHERGAFTGAVRRTIGRFERAQGGTLFLDEVGTLKPPVQLKLLRVLQEREIERVGGTQRIPIDVRIIAATNADLRAGVAAKTFRDDLYYRLNVVRITMPPLRSRVEDIAPLVRHFVERWAAELRRTVEGVDPEALRLLNGYAWPGNVRELENVIERAVALATGPVIGPDDLPLDLAVAAASAIVGEKGTSNLKAAMEQFERQFVLRVLDRAGGNHREAARRLGIHRNTLEGKLGKWGNG